MRPPTVELIAIVVVALALMRLWQSATVLPLLEQGDYYEGIVYDNAARLLRGEPLYQPLERAPYEVAAYMPLYPLAAAGARLLAGDGFGPGRAVSLLAGLTIAALVARLAAQRLNRWFAGVFAGAVFLALGLPGVFPWIVLYRVDTLGVAFAVAAVALLASGKITLPRVLLAGLFAGLALLTKQLLFASALAGTIWLWQYDRRSALAFAAVVALLVGSVVGVLELATGAFLVNAVGSNLNPMSLDILAGNLKLMAQYQAGPFVAAAVGVFGSTLVRRKASSDLVVLYWVASWIPLLGMSKAGAYHNYWLETAAITAVLATQAVWPMAGQLVEQTLRPKTVSLAAFALGLALSGGLLSYIEAATAISTASTRRSREVALQGIIERVRAEPGDVLAEPYDVLVLADRPVLLETVIFGILERQGRWDAAPMVDRVCSGEVRLLVLNMPLEDAARYTPSGMDWWPRPVMAALQSTMRLEGIEANRFLYVPRDAEQTSSCEGSARTTVPQ